MRRLREWYEKLSFEAFLKLQIALWGGLGVFLYLIHLVYE